MALKSMVIYVNMMFIHTFEFAFEFVFLIPFLSKKLSTIFTSQTVNPNPIDYFVL